MTEENTLSVQEKLALITQDLQEIIDKEQLEAIVKERALKVYWGTAPTGNPSVGYLVPLGKIADFLQAGCEVTILFADLHAYLDAMKSGWELLEHRSKYYEFLIKELLLSLQVPIGKLRFVKGTSFQLQEKYTLDMYKLAAIVSTRDTSRAGAEVVKQSETPKMSSLLYPILQALDEEYLDVDAQFGGVDQRKILMFAREFLPKIGYKKRIELMNELIPGLGKSGKMSSSEPDSKIDFSDSPKKIRKKISKAFCEDGIVKDNGLLALLKHIVFRYLNLQKRDFTIDRPEEYGGAITFTSYEELEKAFAAKELSSIDLKQGVAAELIKIVEPIQAKINENHELLDNAYPSK